MDGKEWMEIEKPHPHDSVTVPIIMLITWVDSCSSPGWIDSERCKAESMVCETVGFFVDETDDAICLALNRTVGQGFRPFGDLISIPKITIKERRVIFPQITQGG